MAHLPHPQPRRVLDGYLVLAVLITAAWLAQVLIRFVHVPDPAILAGALEPLEPLAGGMLVLAVVVLTVRWRHDGVPPRRRLLGPQDRAVELLGGYLLVALGALVVVSAVKLVLEPDGLAAWLGLLGDLTLPLLVGFVALVSYLVATAPGTEAQGNGRRL